MDYEICNICGAERSALNIGENGACKDVQTCLSNAKRDLERRLFEATKVLHAMAEMMFSPGNAVHTRREAELVIREWMNKED